MMDPRIVVSARRAPPTIESFVIYHPPPLGTVTMGWLGGGAGVRHGCRHRSEGCQSGAPLVRAAIGDGGRAAPSGQNNPMIGLDTNILVRFLVQDDPGQGAAARSLMARCSAREPGFVGREVLVELVWVLERAYGKSPGTIAGVILGLLESEELVVEAEADALAAATAYAEGAGDFADHMIAAATLSAGCRTLYTFDRRAARHNGVTLLVR